MLPALRAYDRLIGCGAADARDWCHTGQALNDVGEYAQAIGAYEESLRRDQASAEAHHAFSRVLYRLGEVDRAADQLRQAIDAGGGIRSRLSLATMIPCAPSATQAEVLTVRRACAQHLEPAAPAVVRKARPAAPALPLRVGYLSSYFHSANYMKPVWGLIRRHDRAHVRVHLLVDGPVDELRAYQAHDSDRVHGVGHLDNHELADMIDGLGLDIVVDLNGYSVPERLALFASRRRPVSVAWFNYYAPPAVSGFDLLVGDRVVVRPGEAGALGVPYHALEHSYLTFEQTHRSPPVSPPPCASDAPFTFGSLVAQYKITRPVVAAWTAILRQTEGTRLLLANRALKSPHNRARVRERFAAQGVAPERVVLLGPAAHMDYLRYYDRVDLALDAFPYSGGTTTMEALWQGVPVITLAGDRWAARTSASLLTHSHLDGVVAPDAGTYVELAVRWARRADAAAVLGELRRTMRDRLAASSVCDTQGLAEEMETLYVDLLSEET